MKQLLVLTFLVLPAVLPAQNGWRYIGPEEREISHISVRGDLIFASVVIPPIGGGYSTRLIYRTTDAGNTWEKIDTNLIDRYAEITILDGNPLRLLGASNTHFYFSNDLGDTWDSTQQNKPYLFRFFEKSHVTGLVFGIGESFPDVDRLFRSTDYGRTWLEPYIFINSSDGSDLSIGLSHNSPHMYVSDDAGILGNYFYNSTDNGDTWNYRWGSNDDFRPIILLVDKEDPSTLISVYDKLYHSTDGGVTWFTDGIIYPYALITIVQDNVESNRLFMQGHVSKSIFDVSAAIYLSSDRGTTWQYDSSCLQLPQVTLNRRSQSRNFYYDSKKKRLYIGTTKGLYVKDYGVTSVENPMSVPSDQLLCYPQPARQYIVFQHVSPDPSQQTVLRIYNTLGRLVQEQRVVASAMYVWNLLDWAGNVVPDGLYVLAVSSKEGVRTKTFIINRY